MRKYSMIFLVLPAVILISCLGGSKQAPVGEPSRSEDSVETFIFVETPVINIDSDLMAERFGARQRASLHVTIDSLTALKAVYEILLDSILGQESAHFDLAAEQPNLYWQYIKLRHEKVMRLMFQKIIVDSVAASDSAVQVLYEDQKETFLVPDKYRARHIVVAGEGLRRTEDSLFYKDFSDEQVDSLAHAKIQEYRQRIMKGDNFDTLAILYSQDINTAQKGGDLGYFELVQMVPPFDSTVANTPVGKVSGIIKTEYGWHIVKVEDFSPQHYMPLDSVYAQLEMKIKEDLVVARSRAFTDSLKETAHLVFDTASLLIVDSLHQDQDVLAFVNPDDKEFGCDTIIFRDYREHIYSYKKFKQIEGELGLDDKIELLTGVSMRFLLTQLARKLGYYDDPEVAAWAENTVKKYSVSTMKKRLMEDDYEPSEEELRAYYDSHLDDYVVERPLTVQHIVFEDSSLAEHVRDQLMSGVDFMEMVDMYYPGDPEIRHAASDLGDIGPDDMPFEFFAAAKRTPVGEISRPVKTMYGYHLIKVLKKTLSIDFEQARINIKSFLKKDHLENNLKNYVDTRLQNPPVIHWELLNKLYFERPTMPNFSQLRSQP